MSKVSSAPIAPRKHKMEKQDLSRAWSFPWALFRGILIRNSCNIWIWAGSGLWLCWGPAHPAAPLGGGAWTGRDGASRGDEVIFGKDQGSTVPWRHVFGAAPLEWEGRTRGWLWVCLCFGVPSATLPPLWQESRPLCHPIPGAAPCPASSQAIP